MRPERCAGVFSIRSRPPIPAATNPPPRGGGVRGVGARPESLKKGRSGETFCKTRGRSVQVRKTGQPSVFPVHSTETNREFLRKGIRNNILLCGFLRRNRQDAPDRRSPEKRGNARHCAQRRSAAAGRPGKFLRNEERSVQLRETGQPPVFPARLPESDIKRPLKNTGKKAKDGYPVVSRSASIALRPSLSILPGPVLGRASTMRISLGRLYFARLASAWRCNSSTFVSASGCRAT